MVMSPARASLSASWNHRLVQSDTTSASGTRSSSWSPHAAAKSRTSARPELAAAAAAAAEFLGVSSGAGGVFAAFPAVDEEEEGERRLRA